ncbi:B3 DNA binding domain [Macleaya cordata]|uniref:B3 DNA binding domain n=1 Tax=Macleaya cordata TaxID=56857 RepID=A0A200Q4W4_MACCD|nr:B3 DNA binding domain [Macleaya cordata]
MQRGYAQNEVRVNDSPPSSPNPSSSSSSSTSSDSAHGTDPSRFNFSIPPFSRFSGDGFFEEKRKNVEFGERLIDETIDRRKFLRPTLPVPSLISASAATVDGFSMDKSLNNQVIQSQPGVSGGQAECSHILPRVTNSWGPQPVENPYIFHCFPYNSICVSSATTPSLKRKSEDSVNSFDPAQMESLFGQLPGGISKKSVLHTGFVPVQALFQNPLFPTAVRGQPVNYAMTPPLNLEATRNQEMNFFAASRGQLNDNSLGGNASDPMHKQKVVHPRLSSSTSVAVVSDGRRNANSEPSAKNVYPLMPEHNALEATSKPSWVSTHSEICLGYLPSAKSYRPEYDKEIEGKGLMLLVQKELRNTDVGNLGRIVLPKKDAEANLPPLDAKDGLILQMADMNYSVEWRFKYRYWPNNKSRMYVMENTGDFVKMHNLQTGDLFMIYKEEISGKYIVRGKKGIIPLYMGDMVETRDQGRAQEGESGAASGQFGSEQRNPVPVDFFVDLKAEQDAIASRISFDFKGNTGGPSTCQFLPVVEQNHTILAVGVIPSKDGGFTLDSIAPHGEVYGVAHPTLPVGGTILHSSNIFLTPIGLGQ